MLVAEAHHPTLDILLVDPATRASGKLPAVGSLIVAELDDRNRGVGVTFKMACLAYHKRHQLIRVGRLILGTG